MSYGVDHHRQAVRLLETQFQSNLADLQTVKRDIKEARSKGEVATRYTSRRRSISRAVVRTRKDMERMQASLQKREEWERANGG